MSAHQAFIALGSNLGDPERTLRRAVSALAETPDVHLRAASPLYRTAPVGLSNQPDFVNAVAQVSTTLEPEALLDELLAIEARFGRTREKKNGPRLLDLDLLLFDELERSTPRLTLPHPRLHLRAFVLVPLAAIASPELVIPGRGRLDAWLPAVSLQAITRLP